MIQRATREGPRIGRRTRGLLLAALATVGCSSPGPAPQPEIRVGVLATFGALASSSGEPTVTAARMVADEINTAGGIDIDGVRHTVTVVVHEHEDRADAAAGGARSLINQHGVVALIGPQLSRHAIPVSNVAEAARVPMISPMSSNPETTRNKRYVFRMAFLDDAQGAVLAEFALEELEATRAAVLFDAARSYSRDLAALFIDRFTSAGGDVVAVETYTSDEEPDYRDQLERIRTSRPDVVMLPNYTTHAASQVRQIRELGISAAILGGDTWDLRSLPAIPEADGAYVSHQWNAAFPTDRAREFIERYERLYGGPPRATAAMTYDAAHVLFRAIDQVGSLDADDIRVGIAGISEFEGVTGTISFNGTGDPRRSVSISRITEGGITLHSVRSPRS